MMGRRGFSLVEMIIVLVLAGIVSTAAFGMFTTQNRMNAAMTALGESQESARSAVQLAAGELRSASGGSLITARADRLVVRVPLVVGMVCGIINANMSAVFFPLNGSPPLDFRTDIDAFDVRSEYGTWSVHMQPRASDHFNGRASRQPCIDAGGGTAGTDDDYATMRVGNGATLGSAVRLFREISYYFSTSTLDTSRRAFYRSAQGEQIELAQGFSDDTRFEYLVSGDTAWQTTVASNRLEDVTAVRLVAEVVGEGASGSVTQNATFSLSREIQLRNAQ